MASTTTVGPVDVTIPQLDIIRHSTYGAMAVPRSAGSDRQKPGKSAYHLVSAIAASATDSRPFGRIVYTEDKPSCDSQSAIAGANQGLCETYLYGYVNYSKCGSTPGAATISVTASVKGAAATSWNCNTVGTSNLWLQYANTTLQPKDVGTVVCINGLTGASKLTASFTAPTFLGTYVKGTTGFNIGLGEGGLPSTSTSGSQTPNQQHSK